MSTPRGLTALRPLLDAGARVGAGADNVRDPFNPVGRSDALETASPARHRGASLARRGVTAVTDGARSVMVPAARRRLGRGPRRAPRRARHVPLRGDRGGLGRPLRHPRRRSRLPHDRAVRDRRRSACPFPDPRSELTAVSITAPVATSDRHPARLPRCRDDVPGWHGRPLRRRPHRQARRVRHRRRPLGLRQVDPAAHRLGPRDRLARHGRPSTTTASATSSRTRPCCRGARCRRNVELLAELHGVAEGRARARRPRRRSTSSACTASRSTTRRRSRAA